ncbi:MAG: hypothetical protein P8Q32_03160 [Candidatus Thalassarchaeaceae archaeon]|nr:hypothetical protein [Candidatus Thalassarchaeaceae archaeon]
MPSMIRITGWFSLILGLIFFFIVQGQLELVSSVAIGIVLLSILTVLMFTGNQKLVPPSISEELSPKETTQVVHTPEISQPINELENISEKRDEKLRRSRRRAKDSPMPPPEIPLLPVNDLLSSMEMPPLPSMGAQAVAGTKLAEKLVITSDAQSEMESEIEAFVDQRRSRQAEIRSSLERKRRMALAERRAAKARLWTEVEDGEDLATLLNDPNHGLTIIEEPENSDGSKPLGVSYIRIDNMRILKIKIPLEVEKKDKQRNNLDVISVPLDVPPPLGIPPMPPPPGMPPMPPPPGMPPMPSQMDKNPE